ncbi:MAG TPA: molybdopterin-dependent oxidoreductase [Terriglobia bacterium]|nr:molybdopterin-dependent oxidoreductase [Terriglobia bacterium]
MRRRQFLELTGLATALCPSSLFAARHLISNDPLIIETDFAGHVEPVTSFDDFTIYNHFSLPVLPPPAELPIDGDVAHPYSIGIERLITLTPAKVTAVLESAGNGGGPRGLMSNGVWEGWRLADVLRIAQPEKEAAWVNFYGADGYVRGVPLDRVMGCGLLIDRLNGRLLDKTHGLPYRAALPGWYGMDWVKWLSWIQVVKEPLASTDNDYLELWRGPGGHTIRRQLPPVQVKSVIVSPLKGAMLNAGKVELSGVAWSGNGISKVEVSADGGSTWSEAQMDAAETCSWRVWRTELVLREQGLVTLACRATDSQGLAQPATRDPARLDYFALNEIQRIRCLVV